MSKLRAKFHCQNISEDGLVTLHAVYGNDESDNEENNQFSEATPYGELEMQVDNPNAKGFFEEGEEYYLDFQKAK
ncbi:MAG TPA: hypothetical protein VLA13_02030 [Massilibacterium sp.]|nr:hypothetical protein [Massilibacterium sp.]